MSGVLDVRFPDPTQEGAFHAWERRHATRATLARFGAWTLNDLLLDREVVVERRVTPDMINASVADLLAVAKILQAMGGAGSNEDIGVIHSVIHALDRVMMIGDDAGRAVELKAARPLLTGTLKRMQRTSRRAAV